MFVLSTCARVLSEIPCPSLLSRIAKKAWKHTEYAQHQRKSPEPKMEALLVGATNKCFKVTYCKPTDSDSTADSSPFASVNGDMNAFMRVQGAGSVLSNPREQELAIFQYASRNALGPRLYAVFENGYVAEFMRGRVVAVDEMAEPKMMEQIARLTARWHTLSIPSTVVAKRLIQWKGRKPLRTMSLHANTWHMIDKWLVRAKRLYATEDAVSLSLGRPSTFQQFVNELDSTKLDLLPYYANLSSIVLCHNDLNHGNLLWDEKKDQLLAVDLEFAGLNHRGFDLGNHFCEWAGLELHYYKCPSDDQMRQWLSVYLETVGGFCKLACCSSDAAEASLDSNNQAAQVDTSNANGSHDTPSSQTTAILSEMTGSRSSTPVPPSSDSFHLTKAQLIEELVVESRKWMQASHLFWWLWAMIQIKISNIEGFDARNYAQVRWNEYMKHKETTQALKHPERLLKIAPPFAKVFASPCEASMNKVHRRRSSSAKR